jgi:hypothetical protein
MKSRISTLAVAALLTLAGCGKEKPDCTGAAVVCGGLCVSLETDNANCGACGLTCQAGLVNCGGKCIDPLTDRAFCGATGTCAGAEAGQVCAAGEVCSAGTCALSCQAGLVDCGGKCVDPLFDPNYCGAAADCTGGTVCVAGQACYPGTCRDLVPPCGWEQVYFADLTVLPPGGVATNGAIGGQGVQAVYGRTAWYVTSDWSLLSVPVTLLPSDDYFSVQVDVYLPAGSATQEQRAGIFVFNDPDPGLSFGTHGLLSTLQNSGAGSSALRWWVYPLANPPDAFNATSVVTFLPDQWHTLRVEGQRSCAGSARSSTEWNSASGAVPVTRRGR